jgi:hypothetical protein
MFSPAAGVALIDALASEPSLKSYLLLSSVRGDFLFMLGRFAEAQAEFEHAASFTHNAPKANFCPIAPERAREGQRSRSHCEEIGTSRALHASVPLFAWQSRLRSYSFVFSTA